MVKSAIKLTIIKELVREDTTVRMMKKNIRQSLTRFGKNQISLVYWMCKTYLREQDLVNQRKRRNGHRNQKLKMYIKRNTRKSSPSFRIDITNSNDCKNDRHVQCNTIDLFNRRASTRNNRSSRPCQQRNNIRHLGRVNFNSSRNKSFARNIQ